MATLDSSPINTEEMAPRGNSESARLISQNTSARPNYFNAPSYISALIFLLILFYCCFKDGITLFSFHPILMTLGWLVFMTVAVNSITPGDLASEWMPIRLRSARHWVIQLFTAIIVTIGFLVILSNKIRNGAFHFTTLHAKFGLASFVLMFGTMLGGLCALYSIKLKYYIQPIFMKIIHASAGIITFSMGTATISLGLYSNWWKFGETLRYISLFLVILIAIITILRPSLKIYFRVKERFDNIQ